MVKRAVWERCRLCDFGVMQFWGSCGLSVSDMKMVIACLTQVEAV